MRALWVILLIASLPSCSRQEPPRRDKLLADGNTPGLRCWFVEDNGSGAQGYAAFDARLLTQPPDGNGLFTSIEELSLALKAKKINAYIEPSFGGRTPEGWRIRSLTGDETQKLYDSMEKAAGFGGGPQVAR